jgi:small subunit ribosomal protein S20
LKARLIKLLKDYQTMPIIKSAKKRVRVANKAAIRNSKTKRSLKSALKIFHKTVGSDSKKTVAAQSKAQSELDKAAKKGVIHKNKAARQKSKLAAKAKAAGANNAPKAKKPAAKKSAPTKSTNKKPAAKKA